MSPAASVVALTWAQFLAFMRDVWQPGWHIAVIGPTGEGKTTLCVGLLSTRRYVLALDAKGEDDTLAASGYQRVQSVPPYEPWDLRNRHAWGKIDQAIAEGKDMRLIVGGASRTAEQDARLRVLMHETIEYARGVGGWTVYVDEFELVSSGRMYNLGRYVERMLITARSAKTSIVTAYQAPAWVSKHATRQARFAIVYSTGSREMIKEIAQSMGRDWRELGSAIDELPPYYVLVIPRGKNGGPMILTTAPELTAAA